MIITEASRLMIHNSFQNILFTYLALTSGGLYRTRNKTNIAGRHDRKKQKLNLTLRFSLKFISSARK